MLLMGIYYALSAQTGFMRYVLKLRENVWDYRQALAALR